ncbi:hypothetical protein ACP4OV_022768 [Aristida adscensionis]
MRQGSIPKIDFAGIDPADAEGGGGGGGDEARSRWAAVRSAVVDALRTHGCFEAVSDGLVSPELRGAVLGAGGALEALHSLPVSAKERSNNRMPHRGYLASLPGLAYESSVIMEPLSLRSVRAFAHLMWPHHTANAASFCESIHAYVEKVEVLVSVVRRMVLQSVGATPEYIDNLAKATSFKLRLAAYTPPGNAEGRLGLYAHRDTSYLTVLSQNDIDGIELEDGRGWTPLALSPGSFLVLAGEMLRALSNGQVYSPLHRVVVAGDRTRYSAILFASPRDDFVVQAVDEAVDADHPAIFRPFKYGDYYVFCYNTHNNQRLPDNLDTFALRRSD